MRLENSKKIRETAYIIATQSYSKILVINPSITIDDWVKVVIDNLLNLSDELLKEQVEWAASIKRQSSSFSRRTNMEEKLLQL